MGTAKHTSTNQASTVYDGFISYSHAADGLLAPRLQSALQRFAKPWWKRRALRVFRDESSLSANPHLWSSITEALDESDWFVLLLSPDAVSSEWVNQEIEYWIEHKDPSRILPVVTDGEFDWDEEVTGDAAPEALRGVFSEEPRWVDLRFARDEEQLDLKNPRFSAAVADIASALRGVPKDELESEEVKQHRRTIRTAWAAGILVLLLGVAAAVAALQSSRNAAEAEHHAEIAARNEATALSEAERADANAAEAEENAGQAELNAKLAGAREMAASAIAVLNNDPELSTLLAVQAIDETPEGVEHPIEVINALWRAGISNRLVDLYPTETGAKLSLSPDGARLAVSENQTLRMLDAATGEPVWAYTEETVDVFDIVDIGPDGRVALGVLNSDAAAVSYETDDVDGRPNRIVILDGDNGQAIHTIEYPDCPGVDNPAWSPDGRYLAVASGHSVGCPRDGAAFWIEVYETESWEPAAFIPFDGGPELVQAQFGRNGPRAVWDDTGALHGLIYGGSVLVVEPETFAPRTRTSATGIGDVSPDGTHYVVDNSSSPGGTAFSAYLIDATTGQSSDVLYDGQDNPSHPNGIEITPDGSLAVIGTVGSHTYVYDMATNEELFRLATGEVAASAYDPATQRLYTAGSDPGVKVWDLRSSTIGVEATADLGRFGWVNGNSFVAGPQATAMDTIDTGSESWQVQLFDPDTGELSHSLLDHVGPVALAIGHWVLYEVAGSETRATILWDPDTGEQIEILACEVPVDNELGGRYCAGDSEPRDWHWQVSPDGEEILAYGSDGEFEFTYSGHFRRIDPDTGEVTESVNPGDQPSPNDPYISLGTGSPSSHTSFAGPLDILTDLWAFGATHQGSATHDLTTGDALFEGGRLYLVLEASPDHGLIAFGDSPNSVTLLDTTVWQEVARIPADARLRGLGFNADGSLLAIGDLRSLRIVDTATGQVVQQMALAGVSDVHWMDDETLLIGTNTGVFGTVSLSTEDFLATVRAGLRRSFTNRECDLYRIDPCPTLDEIKEG